MNILIDYHFLQKYMRMDTKIGRFSVLLLPLQLYCKLKQTRQLQWTARNNCVSLAANRPTITGQ